MPTCSHARAARFGAITAAALAALALGAAPQAPAAGTLVHVYHGDGDATDGVAGADSSNGTLMGNTAFGPGQLGQGFVFDGDDDYVSIAPNASFYPSGSFTVEGRIATTTPVPEEGVHHQAMLAAVYECANFCPSNQANSVWFLLVYDGRAYGFVRDADASGPADQGTGQVLRGGPLLNDGAFHRIVMVRDMDAHVLALYADGIEVAEQPLNGGADSALADLDGENDPVTIGASLLGGSTEPVADVAGTVDEVRFLTGAEYPDATPPAISPVVSGTTGGGGWLTGAAQVSWTVTDESILRTTTGCGDTPLGEGITTLTCQATSAGGSGSRSVTVRRDATPPAVTCPAPPTFGQQAVGSITASVGDAGSGPAQPTVAVTADTQTPGARSAAIIGRDVAGNATTVQCSYTVQAKPATRAVAITKIATLPPTKACVSRRRFPIRLRGVKAAKIVRAQIKLNGKQVRNVAGKALGLPIDLRGLPKGRFTVEIVTTDSAGAKLVGRRTYRTCVPRRR